MIKTMTQEQRDLIDKANIREIKMIDGNTLIAEVLDDTDKTILLYEPLELEFQRPGEASFVPWFFMSNDRYIEVGKDKLVATNECDVDFKIKYLQATVQKANFKAARLVDDIDIPEPDSDIKH